MKKLNPYPVIFFVFFVAALLYSPKLKAQVITRESLALVEFFNNTDGYNRTNRSNWLSGPVGNWFGIVVSSNRVVEIDLIISDTTRLWCDSRWAVRTFFTYFYSKLLTHPYIR